jgi:hypothetical protein
LALWSSAVSPSAKGEEVATVNAWLTYESKGPNANYRGYVVHRFCDGATQTATFEDSRDPVGLQKGQQLVSKE